MLLGLITGTGTETWPGGSEGGHVTHPTRYGDVDLHRGRVGETEVVHISRHGTGHARLSNQVNHRANVAALKDIGVGAVVALTVCGAVDPSLSLGSIVVFDDFHFASNRLPSGEICTFFDIPGAPERGHWIFDRPFCEPMRTAFIDAAGELNLTLVVRATYGHVDGPRFNSKAEIAALAQEGVHAVSQTAGPEIVLCGEAEIPYVLVGFLTDYANGVIEHHSSDGQRPDEELRDRIEQSNRVFASLLERVLPEIAATELPASGTVYHFD